MKIKSLIVGLLVVLSALVPTAANAAPLEGSRTSADLTTSSQLAGAERATTVHPMDTGDYEYICQMPDGNSWSLQVGEATSDCHGSFLQKYINGEMVANYPLVYDGGSVYSGVPPFPWACALGIYGVYVLALYPPTDGVAWVLQGSVAAGGMLGCVA